MQPPRVWRTHYEDECKEKNNAYAFSALRKYPTLVKITSLGRNNLYGSAKLPSDVVNQEVIIDVEKKKKISKVARVINKQLNMYLTPESAVEQIEQIMQQASIDIESVVKQLKLINID